MSRLDGRAKLCVGWEGPAASFLDDPLIQLLVHTRARLPVTLAYQETVTDRGSALRREAAIRRLSRAEKVTLCSAAT